MLEFHAIQGFLAVDGTSVCLACEAGYQAPVSDGGRYRNGTSFSAAQR